MANENDPTARRVIIDSDLKAHRSVSPALAEVIAEKRGVGKRLVIARACALGVYDAASKMTYSEAAVAYVPVGEAPSHAQDKADRKSSYIVAGVIALLACATVSLCKPEDNRSDLEKARDSAFDCVGDVCTVR